MRQYEATEETERLEFARLAAKHFEDHPENITFTLNNPDKGAYMAMRWGLGLDCVLVVKLCEYFEPVNYVQFISREKAKLTREYHEAGMKALQEK